MKPPIPAERARTDSVLHAERDRSDATLMASYSKLEHDRRIKLATEQERAALAELANPAGAEQASPCAANLDGLTSPVDAQAERSAELRAREQVAADQSRVERERQQRVSAHLLVVDRALTDQLMTCERESADHALAARDDFLGMVSHDLRGMIGIIGINAEMIASDADSSQHNIFSCAGDIQTVSSRMNRLVGDLTDFVRIEAGQLSVVRELRDANETLQKVLEIFAPVAAARRIELELKRSGGALMATFDEDRIHQVLANLLNNALKFAPLQGHVVLSALALRNHVLISVTDNGPGIAKDELKQVFGRFWQAPSAVGAGTGLGLYISKRIVEAHHGRIWVRSGPGKGASFCFTIPTFAVDR